MNEHIKYAATVIRAVNHPLRLRIIDYLRLNDASNVTNIYVGMRLEQSVASQHLAILRKARAVTTKRNGKEIQYFVNEGRLKQINDMAISLEK